MSKTILTALALIALLTIPASAGFNTILVVSGFDVPDATFTYCDTSTEFRRVACDLAGTGKGAEDGWVSVQNRNVKEVVITVDTLGATTLEATVEGRFSARTGATQVTTVATLIAPITISAAGNGQVFRFVEVPDELRVGLRESTGTGADSVVVMLNVP